ncbi:hypothetical protein [Endozoicomonas sp. YOMI1]|uniref:hypothetical protein n=1 Tax=Endozoicomonas sp. YOMI1 TaxID=2828739 RepID=UPI0021496F15|nr:hypothetical protein [Endozoicomonas sp. YOMI1]
MYIPDFPTQLNVAYDRYSYFQDRAFSASVQAFSRDVAESATALCAMRTDKTTKNYLQQSAIPFHNPFDDPRFEKRAIVMVNSHLHYLPVSIELQTNDHAPIYIPDNEHFSIQSILGLGQSISTSSSVDRNPHHPVEIDSSGALVQARVEVPDEICTLPIKRNRKHRKLCKDPAYAESQRERKNKRRRERYRDDPDYAERERERRRLFYKNDPNYARRQREQKRELRQDPAYVARERERQRERQKQLRKDPAYIERVRKRERERYRNNPDYAEHRKKIQRERIQARKKEALSKVVNQLLNVTS